MKVLYLDADGPMGGASRSLFEIVRALTALGVKPHFVAVEGTALNFYKQVATDMVTTRGMTKFDNTRYSYYRGARWLVVLREIFHLPFTVAALLRAKRKWGEVDLIHVNEFVFILSGLIAKAIFKAPMLVHVRSLVREGDQSRRVRWLTNVLRTKAAAIVAIDMNTRATLPADLNVDVIQNSFTPKILPDPDTAMLAKLDALRPDSLKVGFVGNLHISKGIFDLLEAAKIVKASGRNVEFLIVGGGTDTDKGLKARVLKTAGLAQNAQMDVAAKVHNEDIADIFHLLGPTFDIQRAYERMDIVAFPSHFDSPGRPVFEAAFSGVPAIVSVSKPFPDTLVDGGTGIAIPMQDPQKLAEAILHFADNRAEAGRMGANAKKLAESNCNPSNNALKLKAVYERVVSKSRG